MLLSKLINGHVRSVHFPACKFYHDKKVQPKKPKNPKLCAYVRKVRKPTRIIYIA